MELFSKIILYAHILCGTIALFAGVSAIALKNNIKWHKRVGYTFYICMTGVFLSSMYLSIHKRSMFLFLVGLFTYHGALIGYRALKHKKLHLGVGVAKLDFVIEYFGGIIYLGLIGFAIYFYTLFQNSEALIPLVFGLIGLRGVILNLRVYYTLKVSKNYWLIKHVGNMMGSYIGTITAFVVNMNKYLHLPELVIWLGPTLILVPIIVMETRKIKSGRRLV